MKCGHNCRAAKVFGDYFLSPPAELLEVEPPAELDEALDELEDVAGADVPLEVEEVEALVPAAELSVLLSFLGVP